MKILYLANHGQQNNDDEGAITDGLRLLGHNVYPIQISNFDHVACSRDEDFDIVLFHKLSIEHAKYVCSRWKGVCWFFDPLNKGFESNDNYIRQIKPYLYKGFFTDGDYVLKQNNPKIIDLKQGFDAKDTTEVLELQNGHLRDLLFIGTVGANGYEERRLYLQELERNFGKIAHTEYSIFKENLTLICRDTKIMLAMPPVTDNYWSNRIYLLGGRGAFVIHPYSKGLEAEFGDLVPFYYDYEHLEGLIKKYLKDDSLRFEKQKELQKLIHEKHCYANRCEELISKL